MKISSLLLVATLSSALSASIFQSAELGVEGWLNKSNGSFGSSRVNTKKKLNPSLSVDVKTSGWLPNVKVGYTQIKNSDTSTYKSTILDAILYSDIADKSIFNQEAVLDFDAGLGVRSIDAKYSNMSATKTIPMGYLKTKITPNNYNVYTVAQLIISPIKDEHVDAKIAIGTKFFNALNAELGYRINKTEMNINSSKINVESKGPYLGLSYVFGANSKSELSSVPAPVLAKKIVEESEDNDNDGDGVANDMDKCLDTPSNTSVNSDGCASQSVQDVSTKSLKIKDLHFKYVSANLNNESIIIINKLAKYLKANPGYTLSIEGHTSNRYPNAREANIKLSKSRANYVKSYLVKKGVEASSISTVGYGPDRPVASNDTKANRKLNRRVEIYLNPIQ